MRPIAMRPTTTASLVIVLALLSLTGCGGSETPASAPSAETEHEEHSEHGHKENEGEHSEPGHKEGEGEHGKAGHDEAAEGHIKLTPQQIQSAGIALATAGPAEVREHLPLYGVIAPNAERMREVTARYPGAIRTLNKRVGDSVRRGETLAVIESNESLQAYSVVAPLDGVITARHANPGEQASDKPLFTIADFSTVWVELALFPRDVAKVRVGQSVRVKSADTGLSADGKVIYVAPFGTSSNQTLTARVQLDNTGRKWPPGLYVTAEVILASTTVPLAVSSDGLQTLEERTVVFVNSKEGFQPRPVELGRTDGDVTEVLTGLTSGETYATKNSFILKAELGKGEAEHSH